MGSLNWERGGMTSIDGQSRNHDEGRFHAETRTRAFNHHTVPPLRCASGAVVAPRPGWAARGSSNGVVDGGGGVPRSCCVPAGRPE